MGGVKTYMKENKNRKLCFFIGAIIGVLVFIAFFGIRIIIPTNTDWIFTNYGDGTQHYLGWVYYRYSPWTFPIGMTEGLTSEGPISCMYTDSIPLLAVFFKLFSSILPETFQYLGIWGVICFALNGGLGASLLSRIKPNLYFTSIGSLFYSVFVPPIFRIPQHNSLGATWLILIGFILIIDHDRKYKHSLTPIILWSLTCAAATLIHPYFIAMLFILMFGYMIIVFCRDKKRLYAICTFASSVIFTLLSLWCIGAFDKKGSLDSEGLGKYSSNLNTFYNGSGLSKFIPSIPVLRGQYEGIGYLGLGMLICFFIGIISAFIHLKSGKGSLKKNLSQYYNKYNIEILTYAIIFTISYVWALSNVIALDDVPIRVIELPQSVFKLLSVFRSTGRFIWIPCLMIITSTLWFISKLNIKTAAVIVTVCAIINCIDFSDWRSKLYTQYNVTSREPDISYTEWKEVSNGVNEIVFLPLPTDHITYMKLYFDIAELASYDKIKLSSFYIARSDYDSLCEYADEEYKILCDGNGKTDKLYVFFDDKDVPNNVKNMTVYELGDYTVARVKK